MKFTNEKATNMLHPSTQRLLDRLLEQTRKRRLKWTETSSGSIAFEAEKYYVVLSGEPQAMQLTDKAGNLLENVTADAIGTTSSDTHGSFQRLFDELYREAARQARGTESAIDELIAELDIDGDGIPDVAAPTQESQLPLAASDDMGDYEDIADESSAASPYSGQSSYETVSATEPHDDVSEQAVGDSVRNMADGMNPQATAMGAVAAATFAYEAGAHEPAGQAAPAPAPTFYETPTGDVYAHQAPATPEPAPSWDTQSSQQGWGTQAQPADPVEPPVAVETAQPVYEPQPTYDTYQAPQDTPPAYQAHQPVETAQTQYEQSPQSWQAQPAETTYEAEPPVEPQSYEPAPAAAYDTPSYETPAYEAPAAQEVTPSHGVEVPAAPSYETPAPAQNTPSYEAHYQTSQVPETGGYETPAPAAAPQAPDYGASPEPAEPVQAHDPWTSERAASVQQWGEAPATDYQAPAYNPSTANVDVPTEQVASTAHTYGEPATQAATDFSSMAGNAVQQASEAANEAADQAYGAARASYEEVAAPISEARGMFIDATDDVVDATFETAGDTLESAAGAVDQGLEAARTFAGEAAASVEASVNDTYQGVTETATEAGEAAGSAFGQFGQRITSGAEQVRDAAGSASNAAAAVGSSAAGMLRHGGEQVEAAASQFGETVGEVSGKLHQPAAAPERPEPEEPEDAPKPKPVTRFNPWN